MHGLRPYWILAPALALAATVVPASTRATEQNVSASGKTGPYEVTLEILPPETFRGDHPAMAWDGGFRPVRIDGPKHPNHHMVVFVKRNGEPVEYAAVDIRFRPAGEPDASWTSLPVARMHDARKGRQTTHFGNNVDLAAGSYAVAVDVDGSTPTTLHVTVPAVG